jgi:UDP-glucose 4-epimerase
MKVLVTGGAGFIGSHIVDSLVARNYEVAVVDSFVTGHRSGVNKAVPYYEMDITENIEEAFRPERPDCVIHLAAQNNVQQSFNDPVMDAKVNILGTVNILECCKKYQVKKIIYASSAAIYGNPKYLGVDEGHPIKPLSFYGISKYTPEQYIQVYASLTGMKYSILRYSNVYGVRQDALGEGGVIAVFMHKFLNRETPVIFGNGQQTRDFIYVADVAQANIAALTQGDDEIMNISTNTQTSINDLISVLNRSFGTSLEPIYREARDGDIMHNYLDNTKALKILSWKPEYRLDEGLRLTIDYYKKQGGGDREEKKSVSGR